jgi:hypothetical protein
LWLEVLLRGRLKEFKLRFGMASVQSQACSLRYLEVVFISFRFRSRAMSLPKVSPEILRKATNSSDARLIVDTPFVRAESGEAFCDTLESFPEVLHAYFSFDTGMTYVICQSDITDSELRQIRARIETLKRQQPEGTFTDSDWYSEYVPQLSPDHFKR